MQRTIVKEAKSVDEAIRLACEELNIDREDAEIEIINEGNKGILGIIGNKNAVVRVTEKITVESIVEDFLTPVFDAMGIEADIDIEKKDEEVVVRLSGENIGIIIGRRGETLDSLQYLLSLVINRTLNVYYRVTLDVADYRRKREETLIRLANRIADKVARTRKNLTLEPMNPYERRIIHSTLQNHKYVDTYSIGEEPNRKVVIRYKHSKAD
ncbi:MAG: protein jag [Clostridiaceae bacterium]|nr:protein jag [Clostridiaceae bacterium]